jgi:hypothetical protein
VIATIYQLFETFWSNTLVYFIGAKQLPEVIRIVSYYVEQDNANINHLLLLEHAQSSGEFPLSDKLRLKARKKKKLSKRNYFPVIPECAMERK